MQLPIVLALLLLSVQNRALISTLQDQMKAMIQHKHQAVQQYK